MNTSTFKTRTLEIAELRDRVSRLEEQNHVFLAGPFIRPQEPSHHPDNKKTAAAKLRHHLYNWLSSEQFHVYLGEDERLRTGAEPHFGEFNNAAVYERHFIKNTSTAVILLPSSAGSFCELGDWATSEEVCRKLLIIIDRKHLGQANYINSGPTAFAKHNYAQIEYISYRRKSEVEKACRSFLENILSRKRARSLYAEP